MEARTHAALSPRQRAVVDALVRLRQETGLNPTVRELADAVGLRSTSSVHHHLLRLERIGVLQRRPGRARAVSLTSDGAAAVRDAG